MNSTVVGKGLIGVGAGFIVFWLLGTAQMMSDGLNAGALFHLDGTVARVLNPSLNYLVSLCVAVLVAGAWGSAEGPR